MSSKQNICIGFVIISIGICIHLIIPSQVSTEPIPGTYGYSKISPATIPKTCAWGLVITGLIWSAIWIRNSLAEKRKDRSEIIKQESDSESKVEGSWFWSLMTWVGFVVYANVIFVLGYMETSIFYGLILGFIMIRAGPKKLRGIQVISFVTAVSLGPFLLNWVFTKFFYVELPSGHISRLLFGV